MSQLERIMGRIYGQKELEDLVETWKSNAQKIVFTNGCFDILHKGHIDYLSKASDLGQKLIVAVNSDESVKTLNKSSHRPLQNQESRTVVLAALAFVDAIVIFNDKSPLNLIKAIKPNVLVKGADYDPIILDPNSPKYIVGSDILRSYGGEVKVIDYLQGYSTTAIEEKILNG